MSETVDVLDLLARLPQRRGLWLWPGWQAARGWMCAIAIAAFLGSSWDRARNLAFVLAAALIFCFLRYRACLRQRLVAAVAVALHVHPELVTLSWRRWRGITLQWIEVRYPDTAPVHEPAKRAAVQVAVQWAIGSPANRYVLSWLQGDYRLRIEVAPFLPDHIDDRAWVPEPVIPMGVCPAEKATVRLSPAAGGRAIPMACWDPRSERDLLIAGVKGAGKSVLARGMLVRALAFSAVDEVYVFDGKASGDYAVLEDRQGVSAVLRSPEAWTAAIEPLRAEMRARYEAAYEYQAGRGPRPPHGRLLIVLDEIQRMIREPGMIDFIDDLARMARGANFRLWVVTQRPDAKDAVPGAIRDQLEDRIIVGWMSPSGARMVLGDDAAAALADGEQHLPRGRAVARLGGVLVTFQTLWLPTPIDDPAVEDLYPPRLVKVSAASLATAADQAATAHLREAKVLDLRGRDAGDSDGIALTAAASAGPARRVRKPSA